MINLIDGAGIFIWPLGLCSIMALFIIIERLIALRPGRIISKSMAENFIKGEIPEEYDDSVSGKIIQFYYSQNPDAEQLKAYSRLQVIHMERGMFILEIVVAAAPLLGLLGTVTGLVKVFANVSPETGMPDPGAFIEGIALALTTTMIGLSIAIPALVGNSYLYRRIDTLAARMNVGVERLIDILKKKQ